MKSGKSHPQIVPRELLLPVVIVNQKLPLESLKNLPLRLQRSDLRISASGTTSAPISFSNGYAGATSAMYSVGSTKNAFSTQPS